MQSHERVGCVTTFNPGVVGYDLSQADCADTSISLQSQIAPAIKTSLWRPPSIERIGESAPDKYRRRVGCAASAAVTTLAAIALVARPATGPTPRVGGGAGWNPAAWLGDGGAYSQGSCGQRTACMADTQRIKHAQMLRLER